MDVVYSVYFGVIPVAICSGHQHYKKECTFLWLLLNLKIEENTIMLKFPCHTFRAGIGTVVNMRFTDSFSAVLWDPPATAGVLSGLFYRVIVMNNNSGQVIVSATTNNSIYPLPGAPISCQYYTANVTAFSVEYYSESVVIGQRANGGKY